MAKGVQIVWDHVYWVLLCLCNYFQGYLVGNPKTDSKFDDNSIIPSSHGFGIISDQIYEVIPRSYALTVWYIFVACVGLKRVNLKTFCSMFSFSFSKAAVENCKGDYVNPANEMCAEVLHTINNVRFLYWPLFLILPMLAIFWLMHIPFIVAHFWSCNGTYLVW